MRSTGLSLLFGFALSLMFPAPASAAFRGPFEFGSFLTQRTVDVGTLSGPELIVDSSAYQIDAFEFQHLNGSGTALSRISWSQVPYGLDGFGPPPYAGFGIDVSQGRVLGTIGPDDILRGSFEGIVSGRLGIVGGAGEVPGQPVALTLQATSNLYGEGVVLSPSVYQAEVTRLRTGEAPFLIYSLDTTVNPVGGQNIADSLALTGDAALAIGDTVEFRLRMLTSFTLNQEGLATTPNPQVGAIFDDWFQVTLVPLAPVPEPGIIVLFAVAVPIVVRMARRNR